MPRRILLLYNTPKAKRYFEALRDHVAGYDIRVRPLLIAAGGARLAPERTAAIADYSVRRKYARYGMSAWRRRWWARTLARAGQYHYNWARRAIERDRPDAIGVWGGQAVDARAAIAAADDLGVARYTFETGLLPRTTTCDPFGVNYDNAVPRDPAFYEAYSGEGVLPSALQQRPSRRAHPTTALPDDYFFVPFQVHLDSQLLLYSPWIRDMVHLFTVVTEAWRERVGEQGPALVFKMHPSCRETYPELRAAAAREPGVTFADGNPTDELIRGARGVITLNSTVGVDALLLDRPVVTLGQACYTIPGVAEHARSVGAVGDWLAQVAAGQPPRAPLRLPFLHYLARDYCIPEPHKAPGPDHFAAMARRFSDARHCVPAHGETAGAGGDDGG